MMELIHLQLCIQLKILQLFMPAVFAAINVFSH